MWSKGLGLLNIFRVIRFFENRTHSISQMTGVTQSVEKAPLVNEPAWHPALSFNDLRGPPLYSTTCISFSEIYYKCHLPGVSAMVHNQPLFSTTNDTPNDCICTMQTAREATRWSRDVNEGVSSANSTAINNQINEKYILFPISLLGWYACWLSVYTLSQCNATMKHGASEFQFKIIVWIRTKSCWGYFDTPSQSFCENKKGSLLNFKVELLYTRSSDIIKSGHTHCHIRYTCDIMWNEIKQMFWTLFELEFLLN